MVRKRLGTPALDQVFAQAKMPVPIPETKTFVSPYHSQTSQTMVSMSQWQRPQTVHVITSHQTILPVSGDAFVTSDRLVSFLKVFLL